MLPQRLLLPVVAAPLRQQPVVVVVALRSVVGVLLLGVDVPLLGVGAVFLPLAVADEVLVDASARLLAAFVVDWAGQREEEAFLAPKRELDLEQLLRELSAWDASFE